MMRRLFGERFLPFDQQDALTYWLAGRARGRTMSVAEAQSAVISATHDMLVATRDAEENLWLACPLRNSYESVKTGQLTPPEPWGRSCAYSCHQSQLLSVTLAVPLYDPV
jgi:hypothetical protein